MQEGLNGVTRDPFSSFFVSHPPSTLFQLHRFSSRNVRISLILFNSIDSLLLGSLDEECTCFHTYQVEMQVLLFLIRVIGYSQHHGWWSAQEHCRNCSRSKFSEQNKGFSVSPHVQTKVLADIKSPGISLKPSLLFDTNLFCSFTQSAST